MSPSGLDSLDVAAACPGDEEFPEAHPPTRSVPSAAAARSDARVRVMHRGWQRAAETTLREVPPAARSAGRSGGTAGAPRPPPPPPPRPRDQPPHEQPDGGRGGRDPTPPETEERPPPRPEEPPPRPRARQTAGS